MIFNEALEMLQAGKFMCREGWESKDEYICLMVGMKHLWKIILQPAPNAGNYILSVEDLLANDWKTFELAKPAIEEVK